VSARVVFVGLDSADPVLLERYEAEGVLPTLSRLRAEARSFDLENQTGALAGGIWYEIWSGRSSARSGLYFPYHQFCSGEVEPRAKRMEEVDLRSFWAAASDGGRRVAVVDVPLAIPVSGLNGAQLLQWGSHDRPYDEWRTPVGEPSALLAELEERHGVYPLWSDGWNVPPRGAACDADDGSDAGRRRLLEALVEGLAASSALRLDILGREHWDLFACGIGEYQCAGHHFWGYEDSGDPRLRGALREVYARADAALGELLDAAGDGATAVVVASHGHGSHSGGGQLLPELLRRLGEARREGVAASARPLIPAPVWNLARRIVPRRLKRRVHPPPLASPSTRAVALGIDQNGWIRLNLRGRDPFGSIEPGAEAEAVLDELTAELLALEQPETGERIVFDVVRTWERFGPGVHPDVPDLIVAFREDLGPLEACRSPSAGLVEAKLWVPDHRTSSHVRRRSRLWIRGAGIVAGAGGGGNVLDIAPTVVRLLDVPAPAWMDGTPLPL
jgi:type I phosphodiesterase/nucleotide pyrophosphatase